MNNLNPFKSVIPSVSGQEMTLINHFKWQVPTNEQLVIIIFIKNVTPSVSGQKMSPIKHMPSGKSQPTDNLHLPFTLCKVTSPN